MADLELHCEGMSCPLPIVQLTKATRQLAAGQTIEVTASDLAFKLDLEAWAKRLGHAIECYEELTDIQRAVVRLQ